MANIQTPPLIRGDFKVEIEGMLSWLPSDRAAKIAEFRRAYERYGLASKAYLTDEEKGFVETYVGWKNTRYLLPRGLGASAFLLLKKLHPKVTRQASRIKAQGIVDEEISALKLNTSKTNSFSSHGINAKLLLALGDTTGQLAARTREIQTQEETHPDYERIWVRCGGLLLQVFPPNYQIDNAYNLSGPVGASFELILEAIEAGAQHQAAADNAGLHAMTFRPE